MWHKQQSSINYFYNNKLIASDLNMEKVKMVVIVLIKILYENVKSYRNILIKDIVFLLGIFVLFCYNLTSYKQTDYETLTLYV